MGDHGRSISRVLTLPAMLVSLAAMASAAQTPSDCHDNLRERVCSETDAQGRRVIVARPHAPAPADDAVPAVALQLRPLFSQRNPILDVVSSGDRLIVLDTAAVTAYTQSSQGWRVSQGAPLAPPAPWPRDPRGRLRLDGDRIEVYLPGMTCRGTAAQLDLLCTAGRQPWPLGIANAGLDPARNVFASPEGLEFYGAVALGDSAGAAWIVGTRDGALAFLDDARRSVGTALPGDEVVGLVDSCRSTPHVVARADTAGGDALAVYQVRDRRLLTSAPSRDLQGTLTALWAAPGSVTGTAVVRAADGERYDAFQISLSCVR